MTIASSPHSFLFFNDTATTEIYTLSLHDALPILSQLALALEADVSARHVSFLETGRALPSREMLLRLAERLEIPLRERNALLLAAGYAPVYAATPLDDPALRAGREAVERVLAGHEPYPALAVDRHWTLVAANRAVASLLELAGVAP